MSTINNCLVSLHCHFNKVIYGPGTSFQSPAYSQKHALNVCHTAHQYLTNFDFDNNLKEITISFVMKVMNQCL